MRLRPSATAQWFVRLLAAALIVTGLGACGSGPMKPADPLEELRRLGAESAEGEAVGRWLLGELVASGGDAARARAARKRLDGLAAPAQKGLFASLARAVDDQVHGRFRGAALAHLDVIAAARSSDHPDAPLVAWYASNHLLALRSGVANLWADARAVVLSTLDHPGNVGWRARGELVEWWSLDGYLEAAQKDAPPADRPAPADKLADKPAAPKGLLDAAAARYGCVEKARLAGPFGHLAAPDHRAHFEAERAGPWPAVFPRDPLRMEPPRIRAVDRTGCSLRASGGAAPGIYYVETFVELPEARELIVAVQGALAIFVDDVEVLTRDTRQWGIWPRFGARLRLDAGRHRVLARVAGSETSIRVLDAAGLPLGSPVSDDPAPPYAITPPVVLPDPNVLAPFLVALGVPAQKGTPRPETGRDLDDPIARVLAAHLAHVEGQDDVSAVLIEPLVKDPERATGPALAMQALFIEKDPIFPQADGRDLMKDLRARAAEKDPELWSPRFWLALDQAEKSGMPEVAPKLVELADHFREVPDILKGLATIYARVGWKVEHHKAVLLAAQRFPDDIDALHAMLRLHDEEGNTDGADKVAARIKKLDPDAEVDFERAVKRRDYKAAIKELERLGAIRKDRRDIAARIKDLLTRAGDSKESMDKLEAAVAKNGTDAGARLALADARLAGGQRDALEKALVDSMKAGSDTAALRDAIELVDGINELSAYRLDGKKVIAAYEAAKPEMPGMAARVLDYSAIWVHPDGSARMLEHEIIAIQSREGIQEQAEQRTPRGIVLKIRTIKKDGRVLEPEIIEGKQTVTMPHLEIGDYIETETVATLRGDGAGGQRFEGPRWFFREEKIPYWRSEFITITPKNRKVDIETGGTVPAPQVVESGAIVTRRWRVDQSPALPEEPASAPIQEFLPNVRLGWGISLDDTIARAVDAVSDETPLDPRLGRVADSIVHGEAPPPAVASSRNNKDKAKDKDKDKNGKDDKPQDEASDERAPIQQRVEIRRAIGDASSIDERARRIYRWVLANVEAGREADGRRTIIGKSGNRTEAFLYLCRLNGIEAARGLVRDRLAAPPIGPMSAAESYGAIAVRVSTERGPRWMVVRDKFAPYGYMPSSLRGQPAIVLRPGAPRETTPNEGAKDGVTHEGTVTLSADGSARLEIDQRYEGKFAIVLRSAFETLPDARFKETIEAQLLPQTMPGARLVSVEVRHLSDLDEPLVLHMKLEMSSFARVRAGELVISPPFQVFLARFVTLPARETPLYISEQMSTRVAMRLAIKLPQGAAVATALEPTSVDDDGRAAVVRDRAERGSLILDRTVDLPAGRIRPDAYAKFQAFARKADGALHRDISVTLPQ